MKSGARPTKIDHRDYDLHRTFGSIAPAQFPDSYFTDAGLDIPNQDALGLPYGCTDFTQSELANDIVEKEQYTPQELEAVTHANASGGLDVRTSLDAASKLGWFNAYFSVRPYQLDFFDSIRLAMLSGAPEKRSVSIGTPWFPVFEQVSSDGVIDAPASYSLTNNTWHNWKVVGWKTINGEPYLIGKSWQGATYGDKGYVYFSRPIINSLMSISGSCAFTGSNMTPQNVQTISVTFIQWITSVMRQLWQYAY